MCGINGFFTLGGGGITATHIKGMKKAIDVMRHRGPDDSGACGFARGQSVIPADDMDTLFNVESLYGMFGFVRLSIKDLTHAGHQPMYSLDRKVAIIFNGEIYNDVELRRELTGKGYVFRSTCDTEVILNTYLEYGISKTLAKLNGMFAISIMDLRNGMLYLARDRYGIKPLYYANYEGKLAFASELKSIIQFDDFKREVNVDSLFTRMACIEPSPEILLKNVSFVEPGEVISVDYSGNIHKERYFDIDSYAALEGNYDERTMLAELEDILKNAVKRQMISDVRVGCQLSGGIDSSILSKISSDQIHESFEGFSITDLNEEKYIDTVRDACSLDVYKYSVPEDYFFNNYQKAIWHHESILHNHSFIQYLYMIEQAKKHITVMISGEGADEIAGGYPNMVAGVLQPFMSEIEANGKFKSYPTYADYVVRFNADSSKVLLGDYVEERIADIHERKCAICNSFSGDNFMKHRKYLMTQKLPELFVRQDKMAMANSVETRVPFVDNEVVDFVMRIPNNMLVRFGAMSPFDIGSNPFGWFQGKYLFKELANKYFGYDFAYRPKTRMASVADSRQWMRDKRFEEIFNDSIIGGIRKRGFLNSDLIKKWYYNIDELSVREYELLWRGISFETWCKLFIDK